MLASNYCTSRKFRKVFIFANQSSTAKIKIPTYTVVYVCESNQARVYCFNADTGAYIPHNTLHYRKWGDDARGSNGVMLDNNSQTLWVTRGSFITDTGRAEVYTRKQ